MAYFIFQQVLPGRRRSAWPLFLTGNLLVEGYPKVGRHCKGPHLRDFHSIACQRSELGLKGGLIFPHGTAIYRRIEMAHSSQGWDRAVAVVGGFRCI